MELIQQGIEKGLISFDSDQKQITYIYQNKRRSYTNPEEHVQAEAFLKLVLEYGYPVERIQQFVSVAMGTTTKEADIIVYEDHQHNKPYIVVECKNYDITENEFKQAIDQAFSYAYALAGTTKFIWITKGNKEEFYRFDKEKDLKTSEANIPYFGENTVKKYKYAKGGEYKNSKGESVKTSDLKKVTESELTRVFKQAHDALWDGGKLNPSQAFDELDKLIFCKVRDEQETHRGNPYQFQIVSEYFDNEEKNLEALKERINTLYEQGKAYDPEIFNKPIDLSKEKIKSIVEYFQSISFLNTDLDSKGKAFETFLGTYFRGEFGQFFTPRNVVKFIVEVLPITNKDRVLDTSCGSGGFLLYCLDKIRKQADQHFDLLNEKVEHFRYWHDFAEKKLFGIEISDQISRVAKMNMIIHDDGHTNVVTFDGLEFIEKIANKTGNRGFAENSFDFIVTNPPFGSTIKQSEKYYMNVGDRNTPYYDFSIKETHWIESRIKVKNALVIRENQSTEILFIEQIYKFLKIDGYAAIVLPDGILTNSSLQYVREGIEEKFRIIAVISLPQTTFTNTGAGVKSSVLFLKKYPLEKTEKIRQIKQNLQDELSQQYQLVKTLEQWDKEKKIALKRLKNIPDFEEQKKAINEEFTDKINNFKEELEELYQTQKRKSLENYPIFMAIADNIGFDATGRTIPQNDLPDITEELKRFIQEINKGTDANFL
jgi:type I restriction enzyme M protein